MKQSRNLRQPREYDLLSNAIRRKAELVQAAREEFKRSRLYDELVMLQKTFKERFKISAI